MPGIHDRDEAALWYALHCLETNYWHDVDFNAGSKAHEFYLSDGLFAVGDGLLPGVQLDQ